MKIYKLTFKSNDYQSVVANDSSVWKELMFFDGIPKSANWKMPSFRVYNPKLKRGAFFGIGPGTIGLWEESIELFRSCIERSGEILPVEVDSQIAYCINILEVCSCLDIEKSKVIFSEATGRVLDIDRFVFIEDSVPESSLFKIPEKCKGMVLSVSTGEEEEFKSIVDSNHCEGLRFDLLYTSQS